MNRIVSLCLFLSSIFLATCSNGGGAGDDFTITYDKNGAERGSVPVSQDSSIVSDNIGNLEKNGYLFDGWNTLADGSGDDYLPGSSCSGKSVKLYAKWAAIFITEPNSQNISSLRTEGVSYAPSISSLSIIGLSDKGKQLANIIVPALIDGNNISSISDGAFSACSNIVRITFAGSITNIGAYILSGCLNLTRIYFQGISPPEIDMQAFSGCPAGVKILVPLANIDSYKTTGNWSNYESSIIESDPGIFQYSLVGNNVIITGLTDYGKTLTSLVLPETIDGYPVTCIGARAFEKHSGLTGNLSIPSCITSIGDYAFFGCNGFTGSLTIPNTVTSIGQYAFAHCTGLSGTLTIENESISIGNCAFLDCNGFTGYLTASNSSSGKGAVSLAISAPTVANNDSFIITSTPAVSFSPIITHDNSNTIATISQTELTPGDYTLTFQYSLPDSISVGKFIKVLHIYNSLTTSISETYQPDIPSIYLTVSGSETVPRNTNTTFVANSVAHGCSVSGYQWFIDGNAQQGGASSSFVFNSNSVGTHYVDCIVYGSNNIQRAVTRYIVVTE